MTSTLDFYWDLASLDEDKRIEAAAGLISALCKFQADMPKTNKIAMTEEDLDRICASDLAYAVRRLIKGLASPRDGARQGFSMTLAELLNRVPNISVKLVLDLLWKCTEATNGMKGQEQRDMRFGRIFGLMALVQSGIIARTGTTPIEIRKIVMELTAMGAKKSYLRETAYVTLVSMVTILGSFSFAEELITMFVAVALDKGTIETPDELYLAMCLRRKYPWYDWATALPHWHGKHMLSEKNVRRIVPILCEVSEENKGLFSSWHQQLHTVWSEIFDLYFNKQREFELESMEPMHFDLLWDAVVERGLFAPGSTQFRRYWGFLLLERLLPYLSEDTVPALMSPNIVRALSDNISVGKKSLLAKVSMRTADSLVSVCEGNTKVGLAVLTHLLNQKGTIGQASGSKQTSLRTMMANRIVAKLDSQAIVGYVTYLQEMYLRPQTAQAKAGVAARCMDKNNMSIKVVDKQRTWAVDQMIRVARFAQLPITDDLTTSVLHFIVAHAAFAPASKDPKKCGIPELATAPEPPLSDNTRNHLCTSLISFVGDLNRFSSQTHGSTDNEAGAQPAGRLLVGCSRSGTVWATSAVDKLLDCASKKTKSVLHGLPESKPTLVEMAKVLHAMAAKSAAYSEAGAVANAQRVRSLELLLGNVCLVGACWTNKDIRAEFLDVALEVAECYRRLEMQLDSETKTPKKSKKHSEGDDEPKPVEVLVDVILSFMTKDLHFLRKLCDQVFVPFTDLMTADAMDAIIGVLQAKEGGDAGAAEDGAAVETEMDADGMMDIDDDDDDSDVSMAGDDDLEQLGAVDEELRRKIQEALGSASAIDNEADGEVSASGEEEEYDDEQMTVFDDKLAEIFRHKKEQKVAVRDLRISLINFKLRALDLVDVFLTKQPDNALVIRLLPTVVDLAKATRADSRTKPLHDRTMAILGARRTKYPTGFDTDAGLSLLDAIHKRARRAQDKAELAMLGNVAAFVTRALMDSTPATANDKDSEKHKTVSSRVFDIAKASLADFMTRKGSQIHADFFRPTTEKLLPSQLDIFWRIAHVALSDYARPGQTVNVYRQVQAFALVEVVVATVPRVMSESSDVTDIGAFVEAVESLLREMQTAVCETIQFAVSDENKVSGSSSAGKLRIEPLRLKEILIHSVDIARRCIAKDDVFRLAAKRAFKTESKWTEGVAALSKASTVFALKIFRAFCTNMAVAENLAEPDAVARVVSAFGKKPKKTGGAGRK
ncbi:DNA-directed DNA polymerase [Coemansia sp. RSA 1813]|nr:DNA-directed DNA polymerase [Coemansia sp. RSA 1843]KAJ2089952.1 DNA-directed DNA polymerase [Coemansia sp. RSA 986]KAJ2570978.1 DNA-directed DNA polymerase [Coemansia sp. RSA 1813]